MIRAELAEIRAVGPHYVHTRQPPAVHNTSPAAEHFRRVISRLSDGQIKREIDTYNMVVRQFFAARIRDPDDPCTARDAIANHYHEVMKLLVQHWGVTYDRKEG